MSLGFFIASALILTAAFKLWVVYVAKHIAFKNPFLFSLLFIILAHSVWTLISYFYPEGFIPIEVLVRGHHVFVLISGFFITACALNVAFNQEPMALALNSLLGAAAVPIVALTLYGDSVTQGFVIESARHQVIRGPLYYLAPGFILLSGVLILLASALAYGFSKDQGHKGRIKRYLFANTPFLLTAIVVLYLLSMHMAVNLMVIMSLSSTLFLILLVLPEKQYSLTGFKFHLPFSGERELATKLIVAGLRFSIRQKTYKETSDSIEKALLLYSLKNNDFVVAQAAQAMGINRTTLYSICRRHNIVFEEASTQK